MFIMETESERGEIFTLTVGLKPPCECSGCRKCNPETQVLCWCENPGPLPIPNPRRRVRLRDNRRPVTQINWGYGPPAQLELPLIFDRAGGNALLGRRWLEFMATKEEKISTCLVCENDDPLIMKDPGDFLPLVFPKSERTTRKLE